MTDCAHNWIEHHSLFGGEPVLDAKVCSICGMSSLPEELPDSGIDVNTGKPARTSADRFWGWNTIYGANGDHATPYMTRVWFGRLRLHIFHRGDQDPDCHDHPWDFWTFPLTPYLEEVINPALAHVARNRTVEQERREVALRRINVVPGWWPTFRPATHTHRVLCAAAPITTPPGPVAGSVFFSNTGSPYRRAAPGKKIVTLVWRGKARRKWGFLKHRDGKWCWVHWKEYVFRGGKSAPCE